MQNNQDVGYLNIISAPKMTQIITEPSCSPGLYVGNTSEAYYEVLHPKETVIILPNFLLSFFPFLLLF